MQVAVADAAGFDAHYHFIRARRGPRSLANMQLAVKSVE
jgi:hypothetical protein